MDNIEYYYIPYANEIKNKNNRIYLQEDIEKNFKHIFRNMTYIKHLRITPPDGVYKIPDFYAIDMDEKKLYIVEVELFKHSIGDHIIPQINGFDRILKEELSRNDLILKIRNELKKKSWKFGKAFS